MRGQIPAGAGILDITFDITSRNNKRVGYIFELKVDMPASKAIAQIKERRNYNEMRNYHTIVLVGLSLNTMSKHIYDAEYIVYDVSTKSEIEKGGYDIGFANENDQLIFNLTVAKKK